MIVITIVINSNNSWKGKVMLPLNMLWCLQKDYELIRSSIKLQ